MNAFIYICLCFLITFGQATKWNKFLPKHGLPPTEDGIKSSRHIYSAIAEMPLDHFNPGNNKTLLMKYYFNSEFFKKDGPLFIMLGGEWTITLDWLQYGQMYEMAKQNGAYMFYTQHRFYGDIIPDNFGTDFSTNNLKYLTIDQSLADIALLIKEFKTFFDFKNSKVVVFGGSYAGNMAIWMRQKYPNLVHAAVSSSAPVLAKVDFQEYHEIIKFELGEECSRTISRAIDEILKLLETPEGVIKIQRDFNMCQRVNTSNPLDKLYLFSHISTHFSNVVQYATCGSIYSRCNVLMEPDTSDYMKLALYMNATFSPECLPNYQELKEHLTNTTPAGQNTRQWFYQQCTQLGFFQTTTSKNQPYRNTLPLEMYQTWCKEFFDKSITSNYTQHGILKTNLKYGGLNPQVTRVISVHGTADPWHKLGLSASQNSSAPVIVVKGSSHCQDLYPISSCDSLELRNAKFTVREYVKQWLQED